MPVSIRKLKGGGFEVSTPTHLHAKRTTLVKAQAQRRIINAADAGHPFTGKRKSHMTTPMRHLKGAS